MRIAEPFQVFFQQMINCNCVLSFLIRRQTRVLKSASCVQALAERTASPIKTPYELLFEMLPVRIGKFTMGKEKASRLSEIAVDMTPSLIDINKSRKGTICPFVSSVLSVVPSDRCLTCTFSLIRCYLILYAWEFHCN